MRKITLPISAAATAAAAIALALPGLGSAEDELPRWQQARAVGEAESCIPLNRIRSTRVHDDRTIDFRMTGGRTYRNTLPYECGGLGFEESFSYSTSLSRLCSVDTITVLHQGGGGINGPTCGLGQFQPVEFPES